jgi:hypothetical protein
VKDRSSEEDIVEVTDQNDREIEVVEELGSMPAAAEEGRAKCQRSRLCGYKKASSRNHALLDPPWHAACSRRHRSGATPFLDCDAWWKKKKKKKKKRREDETPTWRPINTAYLTNNYYDLRCRQSQRARLASHDTRSLFCL